METIKRYGVKMGDLNADAAFTRKSAAGRAVPKKFLETPGRLWFKRMIRVMGLFSFVVTTLTIVTIFLAMLFPVIGNDAVANALTGMVAMLFFVNHLGLFVEMGGDSSGRNWFAHSVGIMCLSLFGTFLAAIVVEIAKSMF